MSPAEVLDFWFGDGDYSPASVQALQSLWFAGRPADDQQIRPHFEHAVRAALTGEFDDWAAAAHSRLALIILLDQFTRVVFRGSAEAFSGDTYAHRLAVEGVAEGMHRELHVVERTFFLLPFEHAEDMQSQDRSITLYQQLLDDAPDEFKELAAESLRYAAAHRDIVVRFGRFPHRNRLLERATTAAEQAYLDGGAPTFGQ